MEIWNDGDFDAARDVRRRHDRQKVLRDGDRPSERGEVSIIVVPPIDGWVAGRWDSAMGRSIGGSVLCVVGEERPQQPSGSGTGIR